MIRINLLKTFSSGGADTDDVSYVQSDERQQIYRAHWRIQSNGDSRSTAPAGHRDSATHWRGAEYAVRHFDLSARAARWDRLARNMATRFSV